MAALTCYGDLWALGRHRLLCMDCSAERAPIRLLRGERPTLAIHDPPYGLRAAGVSWKIGDGRRPGRAAAARGLFPPVYDDDQPFDPSPLLGGADTVVLWGANYYADRLPPRPSWIVWDKRDGLPSNDQGDGEIAWVSHGGRLRIFRHTWNGMIRASERGEPRIHPTQKPLALYRWLMTEYSKPGDLVIDFYAGSGTCLLAAERMGRRAACCEIDSWYCDRIRERYTHETGQASVLLVREEENRDGAETQTENL